MAENETNDEGSLDKECRLMRSVIGGILSDESFALPTEGNKICLNMAGKLAKCYGTSPNEQAVGFAEWLVAKLDGVIVEAQKRGKPNELNKERLWRNFQKLTSSDDFSFKWCSFLTQLQVNNEPLFYQIVTDELFDQLVKNKLAAAAADKDVDETDKYLEEPLLTFEEENAIQYVGGYVIRKLREQPNCIKFKPLLNKMTCEDNQNENDPSALWTNSINRGGLLKITSEANQIFQPIECCLRRYLNANKLPQMDERYKSYLMKMVTNDVLLVHSWF